MCLGVFDDAKLWARVRHQIEKPFRRGPASSEEIGRSVTKSVGRWRDSELSESQLRALLWIRLQAALGVEPTVTRSVRMCVGLADDLVAAGLACVHLEGKQGTREAGVAYGV